MQILAWRLKPGFPAPARRAISSRGRPSRTAFPGRKHIGPLEQRPGHRGCWRYGASDGLGLLEFLEWCEDLHIQPVLAVYAGYSLNRAHLESRARACSPCVQEALDEIEYATGAAGTKWGAERVKDGHPAALRADLYVEIGTEDSFEQDSEAYGRHASASPPLRPRIRREMDREAAVHGRGAGATRLSAGRH